MLRSEDLARTHCCMKAGLAMTMNQQPSQRADISHRIKFTITPFELEHHTRRGRCRGGTCSTKIPLNLLKGR